VAGSNETKSITFASSQPMRYNLRITKCISLLLLIVFSQKMSSRLYYHIRVHVQDNSSACSSPNDARVSNTCSCIDDFYIPFLEPLEQNITIPPKIVTGFIDSYTASVLSISKYFHSLRAPPCLVG